MNWRSGLTSSSFSSLKSINGLRCRSAFKWVAGSHPKVSTGKSICPISVRTCPHFSRSKSKVTVRRTESPKCAMRHGMYRLHTRLIWRRQRRSAATLSTGDSMKIIGLPLAALLVALPSLAFAALCPDGTYVAGDRCTLAPDGSYVGGERARLCPDGSYVSGGQCRLTPGGSYVGGNRSTLCPDGTYVAGRSCRLQPDGSYTGE